jgi:hypothetical protein
MGALPKRKSLLPPAAVSDGYKRDHKLSTVHETVLEMIIYSAHNYQ